MVWRTDAKITLDLYKSHNERLRKVHKLLEDLEKDGVFLKDITLYVDGVEWELDDGPAY